MILNSAAGDTSNTSFERLDKWPLHIGLILPHVALTVNIGVLEHVARLELLLLHSADL
jgi:hypothetical protein